MAHSNKKRLWQNDYTFCHSLSSFHYFISSDQSAFLENAFAEDADIHRYMDAVLILDALLHFMENVQNLLAGGFAVIDDEVRMLGGNLSVSDGEADESQILDHGTYMVSRRTQVHGAGTSLLQRLLGAAGNLVLGHVSLDFIRVSRSKVDLDACDDIAVMHENAVAVTVMEVIPAIGLLQQAVS